MNAITTFATLSDNDLLDRVHHLAANERHATAALIASLAEMDARRLYLGEGCSSLLTWCTQVLHLCEHAAYGRIEAARIARRFPIVLERFADGELTLTAVCLLGRHLTDANIRQLLDAARHRSKREIEHLVAALQPKPDVGTMVRKLPANGHVPALTQHDRQRRELLDEKGGDLLLTPSDERALVPVTRRPVVAPLAPERYKVQFTVGRATHDKLRRAQDLLRHAIPDGDPAEIFDRALTLLVERLEKTTLARATRPRMQTQVTSGSRRIPAAVRRSVWERDGGQCAFVGRSGRCTERAFLEFHHVVPYARGGAATTANIQLRCRAHNQYEAEKDFGASVVRERASEYEGQLGPGRTEFEDERRAGAPDEAMRDRQKRRGRRSILAPT